MQTQTFSEADSAPSPKTSKVSAGDDSTGPNGGTGVQGVLVRPCRAECKKDACDKPAILATVSA